MFSSVFGNREARILVLGLDNAGKTTILCMFSLILSSTLFLLCDFCILGICQSLRILMFDSSLVMQIGFRWGKQSPLYQVGILSQSFLLVTFFFSWRNFVILQHLSVWFPGKSGKFFYRECDFLNKWKIRSTMPIIPSCFLFFKQDFQLIRAFDFVVQQLDLMLKRCSITT